MALNNYLCKLCDYGDYDIPIETHEELSYEEIKELPKDNIDTLNWHNILSDSPHGAAINIVKKYKKVIFGKFDDANDQHVSVVFKQIVDYGKQKALPGIEPGVILETVRKLIKIDRSVVTDSDEIECPRCCHSFHINEVL